VHVLVEKPMTADLAQADRLIAESESRGLVLQVGYLERFALAAAGLDKLIDRPLFIECNRLAPFKPRSLDISVVYDLMIHDIDMVLAMNKSPLQSVDAVGAPVLSKLEDIANSRLRFSDGCVANITASRISIKTERKMRIFQADGYLSVDFLARKVNRVKRPMQAGETIQASESSYEQTDTLKAEIESFIAAVRASRKPEITGHDGRRALEVANRIEASLNAHRSLLHDQGFAPVEIDFSAFASVD
jgi:predicted dehydrogenase